MKIVYISTSIIPSRTANSIHVVKMAQALHDEGHAVLLLIPAIQNGQEPEPEAIYRHYGVRGGFEFRRYKRFQGPLRTLLHAAVIHRTLRQWQPDLVYGRFAPACALASMSGMPVGFEAHGPSWNEGLMTSLSTRLLRQGRGFRRLVVISDALKRMYLKESSFTESDILVAHDGADPVEGVPQRDNPSPLRAGYFGHLYKGRGLDLLADLAARIPDIEFHIFGGTDRDIAYWKNATNSPNIFFHGYVEPGEVARHRAECDVLLAPYQMEVSISGGRGNTSAYMSPLKIFEYMAQGRPIIASDLPVLREILRSEENALLVNPGNVSGWVEALERLRNPELRARLAEAARQEFLGRYTWRIRARTIVKSLTSDAKLSLA